MFRLMVLSKQITTAINVYFFDVNIANDLKFCELL